MEIADITVAYVNPPKDGKRLGSIKSGAGEYFGCAPGLLNEFRQGEQCKIEFSSRKAPDGKVWKTVTKKIGGNNGYVRPIAQGPRQRTNPTDSEQIFVVALLKEIIAPDMGPIALIEKIEELRRVYRNTFGSSERNRDDEMNDFIPEH